MVEETVCTECGHVHEGIVWECEECGSDNLEEVEYVEEEDK